MSFVLACAALLLCADAVPSVCTDADVFTLDGPTKTTPFKQADFKWAVHPRHDYSKTYVAKLFLAQAEFEPERLGRYKMRDNGKQTVCMDCEKALEAIKGMDALTLGLPKIVYLVGWQYNGHDSKYPAFFEGNRGVARPCDKDPLDSVRWLMREAKKYHTTVSLHINLFDAFEDSPLFKEYVREDVLAREKDGSFILGDWGYKVSYAAEWEKGLLQRRIDRLCELLPIRDAGTIHVDAFHNAVPFPVVGANGRHSIKMRSPISPWHGHTREQDMEAKRKIVKYLDSKGIDVTTEGVGGMDVGGGSEGYFPMYWHYNARGYALSLKASQACGGNVYGSQCAFGGNVNGEAVFRSNPDLAKAFDVFKRGFCKTTLITQYLNAFGRKALIEGKDGSIGVFEDGVRTMWKGGRLSVAKDGVILSDGNDTLIPAVWLGDGALVAYSEKGCRDRTWKIPTGVKFFDKVKAWRITAKGREAFSDFTYDGNVLTITLSPNEMVLVKCVTTTLQTRSEAPDAFALQRAEFAKYYREITGRDAPKDCVEFAIAPKVSKSGRDAYEIRSVWRASASASSPAAVTITGSNLRSVWYGLYDLLERRGGCHWFWDGDVVPKKDSIDFSNLDVHEEAHFEYRAIRYFAHRGLTRFQSEHWGPEDWKRELDWVLKKRLNTFMLRIGQDDLFQRAFPDACKYPDPSKRLPGAGSSYNDRTLFWSLQYRGKLRRKIQKYGFDRGLLAPEDFGTMTHWYSRTPEDWLANKKPAFLPQAHGSASGRNGLVWDIRDEKWVDAYWKLTKTAVEQYGAGAPKPQLLHTIGLSERGVYREREKNIAQKIEALNKFFVRARRDYPDAKILLSGWDFYGGWKAEEVRKFLPQLDKGRVILWDYEADCQERRDTFVDWDVIGKFPYTYSTILAFEAGLDARADYPFIEKRQRLVQNDPMCVGWIHWPESAHTDTLFLDFFTANAWSEKPIPHEKVLDEFCAGRYGRNAELMKSVWRDVLDASALRRWDEYSESNLNCAQHLIYHGLMKNGFDKRPAQWGPPIKKALASLRRLENVPWDDEFIKRDSIDVVRMVLDRLIVLKIDELGCAIAAWRGRAGRPRPADAARLEAAPYHDDSPAVRARELAALFNRLADVLALHTDYSLWESYQRLDAIEKIQNPDFTKTLFENAVNQYCLSHQYEAIRYVVEPIAALMAERISKAVETDDRNARFPVQPEMEGMRRLAKAKPLESLKPTLPRTEESFRKILGEVLKPVK